MTPGELYWVEFPNADGHEQAGRRPAIVLQDDNFAGGLSVVFVIPVTSSLANLRFPGTVRIDSSATNGLVADSVALVFQARAIDRKRLGKRLGVVEPAVLSQLYEAFDKLTGRP